jgi:hypothetical protein
VFGVFNERRRRNMNETAHDVLVEIVVKFPSSDVAFNSKILAQLDKVGLNDNGELRIKSSNDDFYPRISIDTNSENKKVLAEFRTSKDCTHEVLIRNTTGIEKKSPLKYTHLSIDDIADRFKKNGITINDIDHVGFNLPWFSSGIHLLIGNLRHNFASKCLYYKFPTGEPWDFIIPGSVHEILRLDEVDYSKKRTPKFEIVSFDASSTPLIQFDVQCNKKYEVFSQIFPEAIRDNQFKNIWIYVENPYNMDVCFVLNETSRSDWSSYFKESRILP